MEPEGCSDLVRRLLLRMLSVAVRGGSPVHPERSSVKGPPHTRNAAGRPLRKTGTKRCRQIAHGSAMKNVRRPLVAVGTALVLVLVEAVADPTGLLALVGWPGGTPQAELGWPLARYVVFLPALVAVVWWSAARAGTRFWTMAAGTTVAVLLAQAATALVMTGDALFSGWAGGYLTAKAVPAALIVAAMTRLAGPRRGTLVLRSPGVVWPYAILLAVLAPLVAGS